MASTQTRRSKVPFWRFPLFLLCSVLWWELVFRFAAVPGFFSTGLFFILGFSVSAAGLLYLITSFGNRQLNWKIALGLLIGFAVLYASQIVYRGVFDTYYILYSVKKAGQVMQFWKETLASIGRNLFPILLLFLPAAVYALVGRKLFPARRTSWQLKVIVAAFTAMVHLLFMIIALLFGRGDGSPGYLYSKQFEAEASMRQFGLLTTERLDLKFMIFGEKTTDDSGTPQSLPVDEEPQTDVPEEPVVYGDNVIASLDFESLIAKESDSTVKAMHEYFSSVTPTKKNADTGRFKGKNLIFIVAEGFSPYAVNQTLTPTLYKLSHEGIQCTNYYTPGWGVSTSDGEYTSLLGLMPATGVHSMEYSADKNMYFSLGKRLKAMGYQTYAFHNHTYSYYGRNKSHPNLGYTYQGIGNGLELDYSTYYPGKNTKTRWPNSDYLMAKATAPKYMDTQPFHTYYMTVSGHMNYTFMGNSMSSFHKAEVQDLPYQSEPCKAYVACQIELDLMLKELIAQLQARGIADDTLIVLSADHYPYGLQQANETDYYSELAGHDTSSIFEKYRNTLIMWSEGMESRVIDAPVYSIDLLPTVSNLFGVEYDSRLVMGRDFLSDAPALVCFSNRSWITDKGRYNSSTKTFTPNEGVTVDDDYVSTVSSIVSKKFKYANLILKKDYYRILFGNS